MKVDLNFSVLKHSSLDLMCLPDVIALAKMLLDATFQATMELLSFSLLFLELADGVPTKPLVLNNSSDDPWLNLKDLCHIFMAFAFILDHEYCFLDLIYPKISLLNFSTASVAATSFKTKCQVRFHFGLLTKPGSSIKPDLSYLLKLLEVIILKLRAFNCLLCLELELLSQSSSQSCILEKSFFW